MMTDTIKKMLETQEKLRMPFEPIQTAIEALRENDTMRSLVEVANRQQEMMRAVYGPLEQLRRAGIFEPDAELASATRQACDLLASIETGFRLPAAADASRLLGELEPIGVAKVFERYHAQNEEIQRAMEAMRTPWLDSEDRLRSIAAFAELQGIGHALRITPAFDVRLTEALRLDLGDWRARIEWPPDIFSDPFARTAFYRERGLDLTLTAFPAGAFQESLNLAGLDGSPPPLVEAYRTDAEAEVDEDEVALVRTNDAHDRLMRFETQIRQFIDERMRAAFGDDWIKHRVPGEIRKAWLVKRQKALDDGERGWPLIAYADFSDYVPIIIRRDNWEALFEPIFRRQTFVQESFQRLYPIRICTMHARLITQDDELYLYVETKRILSAIGIAI